MLVRLYRTRETVFVVRGYAREGTSPAPSRSCARPRTASAWLRSWTG